MYKKQGVWVFDSGTCHFSADVVNETIRRVRAERDRHVLGKSEVKIFFDTSVLIAAILLQHEHHRPSAAAYLKADKKNACCAAHTLAEVYASLTRMPGGQRMASETRHCSSSTRSGSG